MTEKFPSDSILEAFAGTILAAGIRAPDVDEDWIVQANKFLWRLDKALTAPTGLEVYQRVEDGDLEFSVRAGRHFDADGALASYAGATAEALTNNQTNYIYLDEAGALQVNTTGFPTDEVLWPLATILTAGGTYDLNADITDYRGAAMFRPGGIKAAAESIVLDRLRKTADGLDLPTAGDGTNLGYVSGTHGSGPGPRLESTAANNDTVTEKCRFQYALPRDYVAGQPLTLRLILYIGGALQVSATIDAEVYIVDRLYAPVAGDICATAAQAIPVTTPTNRDFVITPTDLDPGIDVLDIELTVALDDTGGAANEKAIISAVELLPTVKA